MQRFPHTYPVTATGAASDDVTLNVKGLPPLFTAAPLEFGGPGDRWSPEHLLVAAVASCFILTFRAVARSSKLDWTRLECSVEGVLDRANGVTRFTRFVTRASLTVAAAADLILCERVLSKAEQGCLVANSLSCERELQMEIIKQSNVETVPEVP